MTVLMTVATVMITATTRTEGRMMSGQASLSSVFVVEMFTFVKPALKSILMCLDIDKF